MFFCWKLKIKLFNFSIIYDIYMLKLNWLERFVLSDNVYCKMLVKEKCKKKKLMFVKYII